MREGDTNNYYLFREERPDVDRIYMNFVQATTGSGWVLYLLSWDEKVTLTILFQWLAAQCIPDARLGTYFWRDILAWP